MDFDDASDIIHTILYLKICMYMNVYTQYIHIYRLSLVKRKKKLPLWCDEDEGYNDENGDIDGTSIQNKRCFGFLGVFFFPWWYFVVFMDYFSSPGQFNVWKWIDKDLSF